MQKLPRPNVFVIIEDALRADRLHCYGNPLPTSPVIDRLASEGVLFRNAIAHSAHTMPCVVSAFTGLDQLTHGLTDARTQAKHNWHGWKTPIDLLEENGYAVSGQDEWIYFHLGDHYFPKTLKEVHAFMEEHRKRGFFMWRMPDYTHLPYNPIPPYDTMFLPAGAKLSHATCERLRTVREKMIIHRPGLTSKTELEMAKGNEGDTWSGEKQRSSDYQRTAAVLELEPEDRPAVAALYDGRVRMLDDEIGEYIQTLEELEILDDTIIVITGDHGEELLERGAIGHSSCSLEGTLYEEAVHVPLLIRYPRGLPRGKVISLQVSQFDIMPTIFSLIGLEMPEGTEGRSLVPVVHDEVTNFKQETFAMVPPCGWQALDDDQRRIWSVRTPEWKLIYYEYEPQSPNRYELFNLRTDPGEKANLYDQNLSIATELKCKLHAWMGRSPSRFLS